MAICISISARITFHLSLDGTSYLLDKDGKTTGQVKGQFVLTRQVNTQSPDLADDVLRRLNLEPNADNTLLLYDNPDLGIRFLYPRRWHVGQIRGRQITLDEPAGNGLMISLEALKDTPSGVDYLSENRAFLVKQKAEILGGDAAQRLSGPPNEETESQGVVAEVLFPNTVPPFFAQGNLTALEPTAADYERRWAGVQAHNRWLADFCAAAPGRRAGLAQVFLNDLDDTLAEVRWANENMRRVRRHPAAERRAQLRDRRRCGIPCYEPLWDLCEELDVVLNIHAGSGLPDFGDARSGAGDHAHRARVVRAPRGVAPDLRRRARAAPEPARRAHRAGDGLDPARRRDARLVPPAHDARRRGRSGVLRRGRQGHVADAERVLPAQLLGRRELPAPVGERAALRGRRRPHHVGRRLPALRGQLPVHDRSAARRVRAVPARGDAA